MLDRETVREMIQDYENLSMIVMGNDAIYVCSDRAINESILISTEEIGIHITNTYITVAEVIYREKYMQIYYVKKEEGYRNSIKSHKIHVPYSSIKYITSIRR